MKKESFGELYEYIKKLRPGFEKNFFGDKHKTGGIILKGLTETAGRLIKENLSKIVVEKIKQRIAAFEKAVNDPKHGVTITVQFIFPLTKGKKLKLRIQEALQNAELVITPGFTQRPVRMRLQQQSQSAVLMNPGSQNNSSKTFYAAITPINSSLINVQKPSFN